MRQLQAYLRAGRPFQGRMRAPILAVASGEIPRRRAFIRLVSMGNKIAKLQTSDRSPQDDCVFCDIVKGVGRGKIYEVCLFSSQLLVLSKTDVVDLRVSIVTSGLPAPFFDFLARHMKSDSYLKFTTIRI